MWNHRRWLRKSDEASEMELDKKDLRILAALQEDARQSLSALGRRIGLSQPAISDRVKKLEDAGIIQGYHASVDLRALGLGLEAIVRVKTTHDRIERCLRGFEAMPEVLEVWRVTGEDCFVVRCAFGEPSALESVVDRLAAEGSVTTSLVLSRPIRKIAAAK
jgi:Lrp/AsnC family transcriptional regulator, leucine-responsive regulatory protein